MLRVLTILALALSLAAGPVGAHGRPPGCVPYYCDLQRLSEILGALHFLRAICGSKEGQKWRNEAQTVIDAEVPNGERHDRMVASFNRGYRSFQQSYHSCTPAADFAIRRYLEEAPKLRATSLPATRTQRSFRINPASRFDADAPIPC